MILSNHPVYPLSDDSYNYLFYLADPKNSCHAH
jgi:hypothetical protein